MCLKLKESISDLGKFKQHFSEKEKKQLRKCFEEIQEYLQKEFIEKDSFRRNVELRLHYSMYTHSYLVLDFKNKDVYLSHRNHACNEDNYFSKNDCSHDVWRYTLCLIVVQRWKEIKETLSKFLDSDKNINELCNEFQI